jgi:hypothetical protein
MLSDSQSLIGRYFTLTVLSGYTPIIHSFAGQVILVSMFFSHFVICNVNVLPFCSLIVLTKVIGLTSDLLILVMMSPETIHALSANPHGIVAVTKTLASLIVGSIKLFSMR